MCLTEPIRAANLMRNTARLAAPAVGFPAPGMYTSPNTNVPSSLHNVASNSRLTINFNPAELLSGPSLIPPPMASSTAISGDQLPKKDQENLHVNTTSDIVPPPPIQLQSLIASANRPAGQLRSRYVLPPQLSQCSSPAPPLSTEDNLTESSTPTSQLESSFSTMTVLPTPTYFDCSSLTQTQEAKQSNDFTAPKVPYEPTKAHWFYSTKTVAHGIIWWPFDIADSQRLEAAATSANLLYVDALSVEAPNTAVPVRGGLYDVLLRERIYKPVYWPADEEEAGEVRRVMWLYRPQNEQRVLPFSETLSKTLEEHYRRALETNIWGGRFSLPSEDVPNETDTYIFHNEKVWEMINREA
ncbi:unnamed protein product [Hydatigera taeniaeformis]|uniref:BAH domain-containing protein n=1 Tax=Hydatigena taeniaeformis TaxID=6205 RepID=A0A0R3WLL1_HYDTA|nr:unnamed protein product [Hydatigera taeniaeformis]